MDNHNVIEQLLLNLSTGHLRELTIFLSTYHLFKYWIQLNFRPSSVNIIVPTYYCEIESLLDYATQLTSIPVEINANFKVYNRCCKIPQYTFPPHSHTSSYTLKNLVRMSIPPVELSDF